MSSNSQQFRIKVLPAVKYVTKAENWQKKN